MFERRDFKYEYDREEVYFKLRAGLSNWLWSRFTKRGKIISLLMRKYSIRVIRRTVTNNYKLCSTIELYADYYGVIVIRQKVPYVARCPYWDYGNIVVEFVPSDFQKISDVLGSDPIDIIKFKAHFKQDILNRFEVCQKSSALNYFINETILADED